MKKTYTLILVVTLLITSLISSVALMIITSDKPNVTSSYDTQIKINEVVLFVEIADDKVSRAKGLSGRTHLTDDNGMLFVFPAPQKVSFWMKDMLFPIDIVFIKNAKVVHIEHNVPNPSPDTPLNELPSYVSPKPVDMVLEVTAGWSVENDIEIGDVLELPV